MYEANANIPAHAPSQGGSQAPSQNSNPTDITDFIKIFNKYFSGTLIKEIIPKMKSIKSMLLLHGKRIIYKERMKYDSKDIKVYENIEYLKERNLKIENQIKLLNKDLELELNFEPDNNKLEDYQMNEVLLSQTAKH